MAIRIRTWRGGAIEESRNVDDLARLVAIPESRTWIDLSRPSPELLRAVTRRLGLHPLIAEEIGEQNQRAGVRLVGDAIHVVTFVLRRKAALETEEVDFVLGRDYLLTVHGPGWDPESAHQLRMGVGTVLANGADYLFYALADAIVDGYFPVIDRIGDEIDDLQDLALAEPSPPTLQRIFALKREMIRIRHVVAPTREVFAQLTSRAFGHIAERHVFYFRDVYDHLIRLDDELDSYRELAAGALDVYLSSVNNNLSTIMKRLTGVTVILAGIGAVAGLFGMSEATSALAGGEGAGFWIVVAAVVVAAILSVLVLRRINWL
ncbi:MAG TPA: magnesium transporter CorA family protein [Candidatus Binatia bacterium]|nr:magnesium transporter CorA family protein [Candidatus Binatia bacterium]